MSIVLAVLGLIVFALLIFLASLPGDYQVRRSVTVNTTPAEAFAAVRDYRGWSRWSPWLIHEPEASLEFSPAPDQIGGWYSWDGRHIGAGRLTHASLQGPTHIVDRIEFLRPFRSVSVVGFEFTQHEDGTEISWTMSGMMPPLLGCLIPLMTRMIAKDYELGLAMLRGQLDPQAERPLIRFDGLTVRTPQSALTLAYSGGLAGMVQAMGKGFPKLKAQAEEHDQGPTGAPFTAYHKVNPKTLQFDCDMAIPVRADTPDGGFVRKTLPGGKYYRVSLEGSYEFLELAWHSAMSHLQMYKLKWDKSRPSLEVYENDPEAVGHSNEVRTSLYIPVR